MSNGTVTMSQNGTFAYVPNAEFNGTDQFEYSIRDMDDDIDVATVTITISSVDDQPNALDDIYVVNEDTSLNVQVGDGLLLNDSVGGDGGVLQSVKVSDPAHGSLFLNADGSFTYSPDPDYEEYIHPGTQTGR